MDEKSNKKKKQAKKITARIFFFCQQEFGSGSAFPFNEENIKNCINHKTIKQWAYICHDKDTYTEEEYKEAYHMYDGQITYKAGDLKAKHWHGVLKTDRAEDVNTIAKWLNIPMQYIEIPRGGNRAFLDCVKYMTHEDSRQQEQGKHLYSDDEMKANFDFRKELIEREERFLKYGKDLKPDEQMKCDVLYYGKTLEECSKEDSYLYMKNCFELEKYRHKYLVEIAEMPTLRINIYIDGPGGMGKNTASRILAKLLCPNIETPYFECGGSGVNFQNYDGEPVIIWNDKRARDFIMEFGRGETFDILDSHPTNSTHNIKYGQTKLINSFNIINGVESYEDFINGLAGEYTDKYGTQFKAEDKSQAQRRFPLILCLREETFDILLNKGVADNTREFDQYIQYNNIIGSFAKLAQKLEGHAQLTIGKRILQPALNGIETIKKNETHKISEIENIPEEFENYGKMIPVKEHNNIDTMTEEEHQKIIELFYKSNSRTGLMEIVKNEYKFLEDKTINAMSIDELKQLVEANLPF